MAAATRHLGFACTYSTTYFPPYQTAKVFSTLDHLTDGRIAWKGVGATRPVDSTGKLPRGEEFKTFAEFKQLVVKEYQPDLVRGLVKNLFVYGTGRKPDVDDMKEIACIMKASAGREYPLRDLLKAVVRSRAFLDPQGPRK